MRLGKTGVARGVLLRYGLAIAGVIAIAAVVSVFPVQLGLARPDASARRAAVVLSEVDQTLEDPASDFIEFSDALRAAHGSYRALPMRNAADNSVGLAMGAALDSYDAIRESWQMELEGAWDPAVQGQPAYWRSFHPSIELEGAGPLAAEALRETLRAEARAHVDEVFAIVDR